MSAKSKLDTVVGLESGTVRLVPYSDEWPGMFTVEAVRLRSALAGILRDIQHVGSTAVQGLTAKPIIDFAVAVNSLDTDLDRCMKPLEDMDYEYKGEYGLPGRHFFVKGKPTIHHVHVVERDSEHWKNWVAFRDFLRTHQDIREEYGNLKKDLAKKYESDRDAYTAAKSEFIDQILQKARPGAVPPEDSSAGVS
jgi:GrpB-like predicted nucleotidyltransferase (UPF0157 family)